MILMILFIPALVRACHPQFQKELRYLDLYLGIQPEADGQLPVKHASHFQQYISASQDLDCKFDGECLWSNLENDGVLDSSDFWHFHKSDKKRFPTQIQPGKRKQPKGTHFIVAGNTTTKPQSAVILSAPIPCQKGEGRLSFNYWLYNFAQLQVLIVKASKRRGHLQIIEKPETDCHFYRPKDDVCQVTIPHIAEPFRIAIRAFSLKDNVVGSMVLLNDIGYNALICDKSPLSTLFESTPIDRTITQPSRIYTLSDMNCVDASSKCRWGNSKQRANTTWRIGKDDDRWNEVMLVTYRSSRPKETFFFLAVDSLTPKPFARFESDLIPCTQKPTTLSFQYWAKPGTQVEVCSIDERGVPLSCAYLTDEDGGEKPIEIVVDPYGKPFRFSFEIITFDQFAGGLVAITNIMLKGLLCSEKLPPVATTISPNTIADAFALSPRPIFEGTYPLQLSCDWTSDPCFQWVDEDGKLFVGKAPEDSEQFPFPEELINGNVGAIFLNGADTSILRSREIPCAWNLEITVTYWRSEHGFIRVCALDQCVDGGKMEGKISLLVSSMRPFEVTIETRSRGNAVVAIDSILTEGESCPIKTLEQTLCDNVKCDFQGTFCGYSTNPVSTGDLPMQLVTKGATVTIDENHNRAVLASSSFEIVQPALLLMKVTQETFGSRLLLCPDAKSEPDSCNELLGPIVLSPQTRELSFPLDPSTRRFAIVFLHDKGAQFGEATFTIHSVDVKTMVGTMVALSEREWRIVRYVYALQASLAAFGVFSNSLLLYVSIRSKSLRTTTNILIGFCSLFDLIHQIGPLIQFPILFGDGVVDSVTCLYLQILPEICISAGCFCVLSIGFDRLLSVTFISTYKMLSRKRYLMAHLLGISLFSSYTLYLMIAYHKPQRLVCSVQAPFHGAAVQLWGQAMYIVNVATVATYAATWIAMKRSGASVHFQRVFRTIFVVMVFDVGGWALTIGTIKAIYAVDISDANRFIFMYVSGLFVNFSVGVKSLIYYNIRHNYFPQRCF